MIRSEIKFFQKLKIENEGSKTFMEKTMGHPSTEKTMGHPSTEKTMGRPSTEKTMGRPSTSWDDLSDRPKRRRTEKV